MCITCIVFFWAVCFKYFAQRNNIVTFIPFNNYKNNNGKNLLQEKIWEKIPQQISQYFQNKNILPNDLKFIDKYKNKGWPNFGFAKIRGDESKFSKC